METEANACASLNRAFRVQKVRKEGRMESMVERKPKEAGIRYFSKREAGFDSLFSLHGHRKMEGAESF